MKTTTRRLILLLFTLLPTTCTLEAKVAAGDSVPEFRPKYSGISIDFGQQFKPYKFFYHRDMLPFENVDQIDSAWVGRSIRFCFSSTIPLSKRLDGEWGIGVHTQGLRERIVNVTAIDTGGNVSAFSSKLQTYYYGCLYFNARCSYELMRTDRMAIYAGGGPWFIFSKFELYPSLVGGDAGIDLYLHNKKKAALRFRAAAGYEFPMGLYWNAGIAVLHVKQKDLNKHPAHYYIRTYDPGE